MPDKDDVGLAAQAIDFPPFRLDLATEQLWRGTQLLSVRPKTFAVLRYLVAHAGRLVTREELCQAVWPKMVGSERAPKQCMRELRDVLGDRGKTPRFIETLGRRGWRFVGEVVSSKEEARGWRLETSPSPQASSLQSPASPIVGRDAELTQLHCLLEKVMTGERQLIFVTGEPGIGKTSLLAAFVAAVQDQQESQKSKDKSQKSKVEDPAPSPQPLVPPVSFAHGQCIEQHGSGEAFLPVLDALGRLARGERYAADRDPAHLRADVARAAPCIY